MPNTGIEASIVGSRLHGNDGEFAVRAMRPRWELEGKIPLVYSDGYDFRILERIKSKGQFNPRLRSQAFSLLAAGLGVRRDQIFEPTPVTDEQLGLVHSDQYLNTLRADPDLFPRVMGLSDLKSVPLNALSEGFLKPIRLATGGTILAVELAQKFGWALNLSGGFHHAKRENAGGFCFIADTALAITSYLSQYPKAQVLYLDLDAHHGDGFASFFEGNSQVAIVDLYNRNLYPYPREKGVPGLAYDVPLDSSVTSFQYLEILKEVLARALSEKRPTLVLYNAGTDVLSGDLTGQMRLTAEAIQERDRLVYAQSFMHGAKVVQVLSGGYSADTPRVIADSISNLKFSIFS